MKKIIALLIVFALAFTLLVGCNDNAETESGHESVEEQSVESKVESVVSEDESSEAESNEASDESKDEELNISDYFAETFDRRDGSKIYCIDNKDQLYNFADLVNKENIDFDGDVVLLRNDIELNPTDNIDDWENNPPENKWTPIGINIYFKGTFSGGYVEDDKDGYYKFLAQSKTINGIYCTYNQNGSGLFANIKNARILCINIGKGKIFGEKGGKYCTAAGLVAYATGSEINMCINYADVSSDRSAAGIANGIGKTEIKWCDNYGEISGDSNAGGILNAFASGGVYNCVNMGKVTANREAGGVISQVYGTGLIVSCVNNGEVTSNQTAGGVIGVIDAEQAIVTACDLLNAGNVSINEGANEKFGLIAGGIIGYERTMSIDGFGDIFVKNALNVGNVDCDFDCGGIVGLSESGNSMYGNCYYLDSTCKNDKYGTRVKKSDITDRKIVKLINNTEDWIVDETLCWYPFLYFTIHPIKNYQGGILF